MDGSDPLEPPFNQAFIEYAQTVGFLIDPARVRTPTDKPRVERVVSFTRDSMFAGEVFVEIEHASTVSRTGAATGPGSITTTV